MTGVVFHGPVPGWLDAARAHARAGDTAAAIGLAERILARTPNHAEVLALRGDMRAKGGDLAAALADLRGRGTSHPMTG